MKPSKEHPELWSYYATFPPDFTCYQPAEGRDSKEDFTSLWILSLLATGEYAYESLEMEEAVWQKVGLTK